MSKEFINQHTVEHNGRYICKYFLEGRCIKVIVIKQINNGITELWTLPTSLVFSCRGISASLSMSTLCRTRKRSFVNFTSRDTAAKEITVFTCTISFNNSKQWVHCK